MAAQGVDQAHRARKTYICENCHKEFELFDSVAQKGHRFCSRACRRLGVLFPCVECDKVVYRKRHLADKIVASGRPVYCSARCRAEHLTLHLACPACGKHFDRWKSQIAREGRGKYCSRKCKDADGRFHLKCSWPGCTSHFDARRANSRYRGIERTVFKTEFNRQGNYSQHPVCAYHQSQVDQYLGGKFRPSARILWLDDPDAEMGVRSVQSPVTRLIIFLKTDGHCSGSGCGLLYDGGYNEWHVDHTIPIFRSGRTVLENLEPMCRACHDAKTAIEKSEVARLRHRLTKAGRWLTHTEKDALILELRSENAALRSELSGYQEAAKCRRNSASTKSFRGARTSGQMSLQL